MNYKDYMNARDTVWKLLDDLKINSMPIDILAICEELGIAVIDYQSGIQMIEALGLEKSFSNDGFTLKRQGEIYIFYNPYLPERRKRFTVAHELGHILLGHLPDAENTTEVTALNREPSASDAPVEQAANVFASRLLAPACVLWGLHVQTAQQIAEVCNISLVAAEFRAKRLFDLYERNERMERQTGRGCFLLSPLERQVYKNFTPYIEKNRL